jgi:hypothetical protein
MPTISQSELTFQSGGKPIRLDAYLPETLGAPVPAVIALHGAGGNVSGMERYASMLAAEGFAVYFLHYFDRTGTESAALQSMKRNCPLWMKTLWDATGHAHLFRQESLRKLLYPLHPAFSFRAEQFNDFCFRARTLLLFLRFLYQCSEIESFKR